MRATLTLAGLATLLIAARLFTGLVVSNDSAEVFLVLKRVPEWAVSRMETAQQPLRRDWILDSDEQALVYEGAYVWLMQAGPALAGLAIAGLSLLALRRR
ncbi:hypothetical protein [Roseomonas indoligenes]|uniref:Uncharacterized protein n=1 Tax=Roseomonas indoligenes TaxID=2820811 RepID=A0A940N1J9_9PROT|nr:hypothetical protein [Pararoseomonas indoligenes]MBP0495563.1 hypothetical protein [Pararoseomonas indoligenes]